MEEEAFILAIKALLRPKEACVRPSTSLRRTVAFVVWGR